MASGIVPISGLEQRLVQLVGSATKFKLPIKVISKMVLSDVQSNFAGGHSPDGVKWKALAHGRPRGGNPRPLRNNDILMGSMNQKVTETEIIVGTNLQYAGVHQWGGTITPKKGKFLAIPLTKDAQMAGSPRNFPRPLTPIIGKNGGVLIETPPRRPRPKGSTAVTAGKGKKKPPPSTAGKAQYALVKRVKIPARPFLGLSAGLLDRVDRLIADEAIKQFRATSGS